MRRLFLILFLVFSVSLVTGQSSTFLGEAGLVQDLSDAEWKNDSFTGDFSEVPYVFATTQTTNGGQDPSGAHVRDVSLEGFETQHCEYDGGDGCDSHAAEDNAWFAVDPSVVDSIDGMDAGTVNTTDDSGGYTVYFDDSIRNKPMIFTNIQTEEGSGDSLNTQARDVTAENATVEFCEQESSDSCDSSHAEEEIAWLAVDPSIIESEEGFDYGNFSKGNSNWQSISFSQSFDQAPMVIADVQTEGGSQEALYPEVNNVDANGASVRFCESDGGDGCDSHNTEKVAWLALSPGIVNINTTETKLCDSRGPSNECIINSQRNVNSQEYDITSRFFVESSSILQALSSKAVFNISNKTTISGLWEGSFDIISDETRLVEGAKLKPGNGEIVIQ